MVEPPIRKKTSLVIPSPYMDHPPTSGYQWIILVMSNVTNKMINGLKLETFKHHQPACLEAFRCRKWMTHSTFSYSVAFFPTVPRINQQQSAPFWEPSTDREGLTSELQTSYFACHLSSISGITIVTYISRSFIQQTNARCVPHFKPFLVFAAIFYGSYVRVTSWLGLVVWKQFVQILTKSNKFKVLTHFVIYVT